MQLLSDWRREERPDGTWFIVDLAQLGFRIEDDGRASGAFLAVAAPRGAIAGGMPALVRGAPGFPPSLILTSFRELDADDTTEASAKLTQVVPATEVSGPVYGLDLVLHRGGKGDDGAALISPSDYGTPTAGQSLFVAPGGTSFTLGWPKVGGMHWATGVTPVPSGSASGPKNMAIVEIAPGFYNFDYRLYPVGCATVVGSGANLRVDLIARLGAIDDPRVLGRCAGLQGQTDRLIITGMPDTNAADSVNFVTAGAGALVYFNTERQGGSATYSAVGTADYARFGVLVVPVTEGA